MKKLFIRLFTETEGQDLIEYGLLAAFISIAAIGVIKLIGPQLNNVFNNVEQSLTQAS